MPILASACHKGYSRSRQAPIALIQHSFLNGYNDQLVAMVTSSLLNFGIRVYSSFISDSLNCTLNRAKGLFLWVAASIPCSGLLFPRGTSCSTRCLGLQRT